MTNFNWYGGQNGTGVKAWTKGVPVEEEAIKQATNITSLPFIHKHVALMPDVHVGMGSTIGSVIPTDKAIIPAAVGVDIGCGMMAVKLGVKSHQLPDNLTAIRSSIEAAVPHGRTDNGGVNDRGAWGEIDSATTGYFKFLIGNSWLMQFSQKHPKLERAAKRALSHVGTLGTGNHFIEICLDENDDVWIMLHTGSRGIGNRIGSYFIELAKQEMRRWHINLPDTNLSYLPEGSEHFDDYVLAVNWAQNYARVNRIIMMANTLSAIQKHFPFELIDSWSQSEMAVNCHHNYVEKENHFGKNVFITRKGAVRAREGDLGIIPGSMGAKSFIVRGKGNKESFCSCSHGAGRVMSRTQAQKEFTVEDHVKDTAGIECRKDAGVIDETPKAYKNIDAVMAAQSDLVEVVHTLRQVVCVKG